MSSKRYVAMFARKTPSFRRCISPLVCRIPPE